MPVLGVPRHEIFAQNIARGVSQRDSYRAAGYETATDDTTDQAASRLSSDVKVIARVAEIQGNAAKRAEITVEKVLLELSKIGFGDIRRAVQWSNQQRESQDEDGLPVLETEVLLVPSAELDDDTSASIAEISQGQHGIKIKMHDKRAALVDIGKHLAMFTDKTELSGPGGGPVQTSVSVSFVEPPKRAE